MGERRVNLRSKWAVGATAAALTFAVALGAPAYSQSSSVSVPNVSGNWAGYVASGTNISSVTGQWTVPTIGTIPGIAATWVGIGGATTTDLIQAGTLQAGPLLDMFGNGNEYAAWYELLPNNPTYFPNPVTPGDHMTVTITNTGVACPSSQSPNGGSPTTWDIDVTDAGNWSQSVSPCYASSESSAEWIHEAPSLEVVPIPVGGPLTVTFAGDNTATGDFTNGTSGTIAATGAVTTIALPVETAVSALDASGEAFNVCTYAVTCAAPS